MIQVVLLEHQVTSLNATAEVRADVSNLVSQQEPFEIEENRIPAR